MTTERDCKHGRQFGKCADCELDHMEMAAAAEARRVDELTALRKDYEALIRQLSDALEWLHLGIGPARDPMRAITAARARWGTPQPIQPESGAVPLTDEQIERAAKKIAECMDYPWGHMPTIGREEMRIHARAALEAAHMEKAP